MMVERYFKYWGKAKRNNDKIEGPRWHPLVYHSMDVAACAEWLIQLNPLPWLRLTQTICIESAKLRNLALFFCTLHDLGKFSLSFQGLASEVFKNNFPKTETIPPYSERHDVLGWRLFQEGKENGGIGDYFTEKFLHRGELKPDKSIKLLYYFAQSAFGHHGVPPYRNDKEVWFRLFPEDTLQDIKDFLDDVSTLFLPDGICFSQEDYLRLKKTTPLFSWGYAGLCIAADWIGSNQAWFHYRHPSDSLHDYWNKVALPIAEKAVRQSGLVEKTSSRMHQVKDLFSDIVEPTPLQKLCNSITLYDGAQLFIIEEITGSGKTEAAITLAQRIMAKKLAKGVFIALPTMATANAMHERVEMVFQKLYDHNQSPNLLLAHSLSRVVHALEKQSVADEFYQKEKTASQNCQEWLSDSRKKCLLSDVGVGTIDQVLLATLKVRHQSLRLFGLLGKVLIVDEVHACDAYMNELLANLIQIHSATGGSVILLSATLPKTIKRKLVQSFQAGISSGSVAESNLSIDYPLLTHIYSDKIEPRTFLSRQELQRKVLIKTAFEEDVIWTYLEKHLREGRCVCWIRNTVKDALTAYDEAIEKFGEDNTELFHARFMMGDRLQIEKNVETTFGKTSSTMNRKGKLLIATQVVEQSLDIDFDAMITDLAPMDLIIQRAGRLQRHRREEDRPEPEIMIFGPQWTDNPEETWFSRFFPAGSYVYRDHAQLWLTAKWLNRNESFSVPEDVRAMVEFVYSEQELPQGLQKRRDRAQGDESAERSMARYNKLQWKEGYTAINQNWVDDERAMTRLGNLTSTVRLLIEQDGKYASLFNIRKSAQERPIIWELSDVKMNGEYDVVEDKKKWAEEVRKDMPGGGKFVVPVLMRKINDQWQGKVWNANKKKEQTILYSKNRGAQLLEGDLEDESD